MTTPALAGRALTKRFGSVLALVAGSLSLQAGEITAIVGENGAGKSTLAKILAGVIGADSGSIEIDGVAVSLHDRRAAAAKGIGFVPQQLSFVTTLSLIENHRIGAGGRNLGRAAAAEALAAACRELGAALPLDVPLGRLGLPQRQLAEIASAVAAGARILLLDEPTSALGPIEIERLIAALRRLAAGGTAIGLVTHRIAEVLRGADQVSVLRAGRLVFAGPTRGITADRIAELMVGASLAEPRRPAAPRDAERLAVEAVSLASSDGPVLEDIAFSVRAGEIVGIAGVASASQTALEEVLTGLRSPDHGRVRLGLLDITGKPAVARRAGLAHLPGERSSGIVPELTVAENASLLRFADRSFTRFGMRRRGAERAEAARIAETWDVRPPRADLAARGLSGGNQQKLLVGRELDRNPAVIIAHGPTQGLDLAAAATIRERLVAAAAAGAAVVLISADLDEILALSHRIIVLSGGRITDEIPAGDSPVDMVRLGSAIGGQHAGTPRPSSKQPSVPEPLVTAPFVSPSIDTPAEATPSLPPLLGSAFPPNSLRADEVAALLRLQQVLDAEITPRAAENDGVGRYPDASIAALKTTGILSSGIARESGGLGFSHRASMEAQIRIAAADSAVAQIFKIHEEVVRDILTFIPNEGRATFIASIVAEQRIHGLAVAENGRTVNDPMATLYTATENGGGLINGRKIYTTGAAGADVIVVWSFDPTDPGIATNPALGLRVSLVPAGTPGITIHRDWDVLGQRATDSGSITFASLRVEPAWNGRAPDRLPPLHAPLRWQLGFAAILIGNAIGALRAAIPFIASRSRPWPSAGVEVASDDPYVRRLTGELTADLAAAYALTLAAADRLDDFEAGKADRTDVAIPIYAAKSAASRSALRATSEIFTLMGTRSVAAANGFDRYWRNVRTLSLHDPVEWKNAEIGQHVLTGWSPPWGVYQ